MPIDMDAYRFPKFITVKPKLPFSEDPKAKFYATEEDERFRVYRNGSFPKQGYNPNLNQAKPENININTDDYTLPPY